MPCRLHLAMRGPTLLFPCAGSGNHPGTALHHVCSQLSCPRSSSLHGHGLGPRAPPCTSSSTDCCTPGLLHPHGKASWALPLPCSFTSPRPTQGPLPAAGDALVQAAVGWGRSWYLSLGLLGKRSL